METDRVKFLSIAFYCAGYEFEKQSYGAISSNTKFFCFQSGITSIWSNAFLTLFVKPLCYVNTYLILSISSLSLKVLSISLN